VEVTISAREFDGWGPLTCAVVALTALGRAARSTVRPAGAVHGTAFGRGPARAGPVRG